MQTIVTTVLVARQGGDWLDQTLAALRGQTRRPDRLVAVAAGGETAWRASSPTAAPSGS
ncbi:hypothetical protein [Leucobacter soli]|uniref:hypothetical protein n=1 Tax=Leucobacter soli TaxID=2812850 RepID=UPI00361C5BD9